MNTSSAMAHHTPKPPPKGTQQVVPLTAKVGTNFTNRVPGKEAGTKPLLNIKHLNSSLRQEGAEK